MRSHDREIRRALQEQLVVDADMAARALNVTAATIRNAIRRGELPSAGVGKCVRVPTIALRERLGLGPKAV